MIYLTIIKNIAIIYFGFLVVIYFLQGSFIYHPTKIQNFDIQKLNDINADIVTVDDLHWLYLPANQDSNKTLIYFHGNAGMAMHRSDKADIWRKNGFNVVLAEYPGYGTNLGKPTEKSIFNAGRVIIDKTMSDFPNHKLYIYGESIGSGVAIQIASEYKVVATIIEGGFSSLVDVAFSKMPFIPVPLILRDKYDNLSKINQIKSRLIILHGAQDNVIPLKFGQRLFDTYEGDKDIRVFDNAGHNDIYQKINMNDVVKDLKL